jgi:hypothetical protein
MIFGKVKLLGNSTLALIDVDYPETRTYQQTCRVLRKVGLSVEYIRYDKSAHGWHMVVKLEQKLTKGEMIALQLLLGSDPCREEWNLMRAISIRQNKITGPWAKRWNLLFEKRLEEPCRKKRSTKTR